MTPFSYPRVTADSFDRHFSAQMFLRFPAAHGQAMERVNTAIARHHRLADDRLHLRPPSLRDAGTFKLLLRERRLDGFLPLSDPHVRRAASRALINAVLQHYAATRDQPGLRHFLFTAVTDAGYSIEHKPTFAPPSLRFATAST